MHRWYDAKRATMRELGFTPSSRVGLPIADDTGDDPEDERWREIKQLMNKAHGEQARLLKQYQRQQQQEEAAAAELIEVRPEGEA